MTIPPEIVSAALTAIGIFAALFGTWLARKGKREDVKIATVSQSLLELRTLAEARDQEIIRLQGALVSERTAHQESRDRAEARWSRQMERCRVMTDSLVTALSAVRAELSSDTRDKALRDLEQHRFEDHLKEE